MSDKVKEHHLARKAILYVRQSSAYQVSHNKESGQLQYAMRSRVSGFGWRDVVSGKVNLTHVAIEI